MDDLEILAHQASQLDAESAPIDPVAQAAAEAEAARPTPEQELAGLILAGGAIAAMRWPSLAQVFTPEKCAATAEALNPAFEKLGWSVTGGQAGVYITAAGAVAMLGFDAYKAIQADTERERMVKLKRDADARAHFAISRGLEGDAPGSPGKVPDGRPENAPAAEVHSQMALYEQ